MSETKTPEQLEAERIAEEARVKAAQSATEIPNYEEFVNTVLDKMEAKARELVTPVDLKYGKLPVDLTEEEKKMPAQVQDAIKANKFFRALYKKDTAYLTSTKAINIEGDNARGGYLTNPEFNKEVFRFLEEYGVIPKYAKKLKMNSQKMLLPISDGRMTGAFVSEASLKPESNPTWTRKELSRKEYAVLSVVSKQFLEDSEVNLMDYMAADVAEDFAYAMDYQGLRGTGSPITGIIGTSGVNVMRTSGTDFGATVTGDKIIDMVHSLSPSRSRGAALIMHRTVFAQIRKLKATGGSEEYIFQDLGTPNSYMIAGYPVILSEAMPAYDAALPAADTAYIIFGNLQNVILGDRNSLEVAMTTDATIGSNNLFEKNLIGFRFEQSYDIIVPKGDAFVVLKSDEA